jgi:hypothetical protein
MRAYLQELRVLAEEQSRIQQLEAEARTISLRQQERRARPLTEQIEELMRTLPPQLRDRPWSMADLVARVQGKYRDRPHAQQVGAACRRLGGTVCAVGNVDMRE